MARSIKSSLFGKLAVKAGFITQEQLQIALQIQLKLEEQKGSSPRLGEILKAKGYIKPGQVEAIMRLIKPQNQISSKARFGEIAASLRMVEVAQIREVLKLQKAYKIKSPEKKTPRIGEFLVKKGYMMPHQVRAVLQQQQKKLTFCPICDAKFNVANFKVGQNISCG